MATETVTVNGNRYRAMLNEFLFTKIEEEDIGKIWFQQANMLLIGNIWFQQDGVTCHTVEATFDVLRPVCEDRIMPFGHLRAVI